MRANLMRGGSSAWVQAGGRRIASASTSEAKRLQDGDGNCGMSATSSARWSVTVLDSDADFTSIFWRFGPDSNLGITSKQTGSTAVIGQVPANTELILGIVVNNTGNTFMTGPGDRNPDDLVHAISRQQMGAELADPEQAQVHHREFG